MEQRSKKILTFLFIASAVISGLSYFILFLQKEQTREKTNLFELILPESNCILCVNQTEYLNGLLKNDTASRLLTELIPGKAFGLLKDIPEGNTKVLSFLDEEILIYSHIDGKTKDRIQHSLFSGLSSYPAQEEIICGNIKAYFHALPEKKFLGYYIRNGVVVAGYSRKLLEKAALRQVLLEQNKTSRSSVWLSASRKLNGNVPINLLFSTAPLKLSLCVDSAEISLSDFTLAADIYYEKDRLCCFGSLPLIQMNDSLYHQLAEKISLQIEKLYPHLTIKTFLEVENGQLFYSVSGMSAISTVNPSNE